jgi:hypothetical protein
MDKGVPVRVTKKWGCGDAAPHSVFGPVGNDTTYRRLY